MAKAINLLTLAAIVLLVLRLFISGLHRRYRGFFVFLIFEALRNGILSSISVTSDAYQKIWVLTEPIEWILYVLVVLELYSLVLEDFRGLSKVGRWALLVAVAVALLASLASLMAPSQNTPQGHLMAYYYVAERAVYFSLVVFLLTILGILMQYPITLNRNIIVHSLVFSVFFLSNTVIYLLLSTRGFEVMHVVQVAAPAVGLGAFVVWLAILNPAGELRKLRLRPDWMPGKEEDLINQLKHFNDALVRATGNRPK